MTARQAAFLSLLKLEKGGKYSNIELNASIEKFGLSGVEKSFYTALLYGVIERKITLDYLLSLFSSRPTESIDRDVKTAIYLGLYQLFFMDKVPPSAAVNESVSLLTRFYAKKNSENFANAVLRAAAKAGKTIEYPFKNSDFIKYLSIKYSVSEWICKKFADELGEQKAEETLAAMCVHPHITIAANTIKTTRDELIKKLTENGIPCRKTTRSPHGIILEENTPYEKIEKFDELFFVQDEASQLCCEALGAEAGDAVLDACACPGGKSFLSAAKMNNRGKIIACDLHKSKLSLISSGASRLGIDIIETIEQNSAVFREDFPLFDKVLCDVPCSGLGVMAKKPEIRYKSQDDVKRLPRLQYEILSNCAKYVKPGGVLVYSTCTLSNDENTSNTARFLLEHSDFIPAEISGGKHEITFFPQDFSSDGFYIAKFLKRG
ncbi:MAG: 16S rRNA (cytosine(967)-C(5))-methyltransferase RsmB [Clostridia bacterium]|nr:16S rRNA (cytosine(967)-C(5))-methyltransferase RsmB [Clostridia bacterium]